MAVVAEGITRKGSTTASSPDAAMILSAGLWPHLWLATIGHNHCVWCCGVWGCIKKFPEAFIIKDGTAGFANHNKPGEGAVDV